MTAAERVTSWPPADFSVTSDWCAHCDFPLDRTLHHGHCLGYIVGAPGLPLCSCPCAERRRAAAVKRRPDPLRDRHQWWRESVDRTNREPV